MGKKGLRQKKVYIALKKVHRKMEYIIAERYIAKKGKLLNVSYIAEREKLHKEGDREKGYFQKGSGGVIVIREEHSSGGEQKGCANPW